MAGPKVGEHLAALVSFGIKAGHLMLLPVYVSAEVISDRKQRHLLSAELSVCR